MARTKKPPTICALCLAARDDPIFRALRDLGADIDLRSIVDSWQDTLPDDDILHLLRNWNAGVPQIQTI